MSYRNFFFHEFLTFGNVNNRIFVWTVHRCFYLLFHIRSEGLMPSFRDSLSVVTVHIPSFFILSPSPLYTFLLHRKCWGEIIMGISSIYIHFATLYRKTIYLLASNSSESFSESLLM